MASAGVSSLLKVLADPTRLRILALLAREELRAGELSQALGMSPSRVSNHLRLLREAGLLEERHAGTSTFLRLAGEGSATQPAQVAESLWRTLGPEIAASSAHALDLRRLEGVIAERERRNAEFFERVAGDWDKIGLDFESGQARQRAAALLLPPGLVLADIGCGTGYLSRALLGLCHRLICVDRSPAMLEEARERLSRAPASTAIEFRLGEREALPLEAGEVDGLLAGMVLHHVEGLERPLSEMLRVLRPGGTAVVLELAPHRELWMHDALGDRHLGLERETVRAAFEKAGFADVELEIADDRYRPALPADVGEAPAQSEDNGRARARLTDNGRARARLALYLVRGRRPPLPQDPGNDSR